MLNKQASYPNINASLYEELAGKVITRVVSDGQSIRNAVREAVKIAELNKQEIVILMSVLQRFGMVQNGDYKNYWTNGFDEFVGSEGLNTNQGTNYYASSKSKIVTAEEKSVFPLFEEVNNLKKSNFSDSEILQINPELEEIVATINNVNKIMEKLSSESFNDININKFIEAKSFNLNEFKKIAQELKDELGQNGVANDAPLTDDKSLPQNDSIEPLEQGVPNLEVSEGDNGLDSGLGGEISVEVTPTPEELSQMAKEGPQWDIKNVLSISKAEEYYSQLRGQLEEVVFNKNIKMDMETVSKYDKIREQIDNQLNKIKEAQKGVEKIEKKEEQLQSKVQPGDLNNVEEEPSVQMKAQEPSLEQAPQDITVEE